MTMSVDVIDAWRSVKKNIQYQNLGGKYGNLIQQKIMLLIEAFEALA